MKRLGGRGDLSDLSDEGTKRRREHIKAEIVKYIRFSDFHEDVLIYLKQYKYASRASRRVLGLIFSVEKLFSTPNTKHKITNNPPSCQKLRSKFYKFN